MMAQRIAFKELFYKHWHLFGDRSAPIIKIPPIDTVKN